MEDEPAMEDELQPEYDLKSLRVRSIGPGRKLMDKLAVYLEPDIALIFPSSEVVNETLRLLIRITKEHQFLSVTREDLKKEMSKLDEHQILKVADYISSLKFQDSQAKLDEPNWRRLTPAERAKDFREWVSQLPKTWQRLTPAERAKDFREWVSQLPKSSSSLPDEAFSRDNIYEE